MYHLSQCQFAIKINKIKLVIFLCTVSLWISYNKLFVLLNSFDAGFSVNAAILHFVQHCVIGNKLKTIILLHFFFTFLSKTCENMHQMWKSRFQSGRNIQQCRVRRRDVWRKTWLMDCCALPNSENVLHKCFPKSENVLQMRFALF